MNTSALATSRISTSRPPSVRRSRASPRLLRFIDGTQAPPKCGRKCSPWSGSTLITSAPMSPSIWPAVGPAMTCVRSRTRVSESGSIFGLVSLLAKLRPIASSRRFDQLRPRRPAGVWPAERAYRVRKHAAAIVSFSEVAASGREDVSSPRIPVPSCLLRCCDLPAQGSAEMRASPALPRRVRHPASRSLAYRVMILLIGHRFGRSGLEAGDRFEPGSAGHARLQRL